MSHNRTSLEILRHWGDITSDGYLVYDLREQVIAYVNQPLIRTLHLTDTTMHTLESIGSAINEEQTTLKACVARLLQEGNVENVELRLAEHDRFVVASAHLLRGDEYVIVVIRDISRSKKALNYITEFGAVKDATLDMVAHNLSAPLNLTDNLLSAIDRLPSDTNSKTIRHYTQIIRENTLRCIETIMMLLQEEHLESEKVFVKSTRFDVIVLIRLVMDTIRPFHQDKALALNCPAAELFVSFDDVKFFQIIHNLVSNSVKFTPAGGNVNVDVIDDDETVSVTIADNGIGIPAYLHNHLFERNTPAARTGLRGERSIGMGLYIVRKLVHLMGGSISFISAEAEGTAFTVTLPKNLLRRT